MEGSLTLSREALKASLRLSLPYLTSILQVPYKEEQVHGLSGRPRQLRSLGAPLIRPAIGHPLYTINSSKK